jgi:hypothetical protein
MRGRARTFEDGWGCEGIPADDTVGFVSARVGAFGFVLAFSGCGTVNPGQDIQFAQITYDQNYFYCEVEPMLFDQGCGPGKTGMDPPSGCHFNVTTFRLSDHAQIPCDNGAPRGLTVSAEAQNNYQVASREMSPDESLSQLLRRPTKQAAHPREIFDSKSPQANLIRQWGTKYTSQ